MIKLFFQDKVIIFDRSNNNKNQKDAFLYNEYTPEQVVDMLSTCNTLYFESENPDNDLESFKQHFVLRTAAGGVVENREKDILMIYRNERWDLPKGKLEDGETIEQCALREVEEETGIDGINHIDEKPFLTQHFYNIYGKWEFKTTYWYKMLYKEALDNRSNKNFIPQKEEGITKVEWLPIAQAQELVKNSYTSIQAVANHFIK